MSEEFKPGCQRPAIKKPARQADTVTIAARGKEKKTNIN